LKRLIKKADAWWDPTLPGATSDEGYFVQLKDDQAILCNESGEVIRTFNLRSLHLNDTDKNEAINILNSYLSELNIEDSLS
jgi:hypothetical protein